jgi:hypothetical protein
MTIDAGEYLGDYCRSRQEEITYEVGLEDLLCALWLILLVVGPAPLLAGIGGGMTLLSMTMLAYTISAGVGVARSRRPQPQPPSVSPWA